MSLSLIHIFRNLDLSNMTIIEGKEGITVVDPLVSAETAKVGMDLYLSLIHISFTGRLTDPAKV